MVIISKEIIDNSLDFSRYSFELSVWQQNAIWGILNNKNVIVSAPTGSGKTLPAEYAIQYFSNLNKKIIYTTPIKALSNQKKFDFSQNFPEISTGILTGDIKDNPEADVILMTTEILKNYFDNNNIYNEFDINIEKDVGIIIYDEAHYINDDSRGHIWEECFIKQPKNIPMLLMSATMSNINEISNWLEETTNREVLLSITNHRIVPLEHYFWYSILESNIKKIKEKPLLKLIDNYSNKPILIKNKDTDYKVENHDNIQKIINKTKHLHIRPYYVINKIVRYIQQNKLTPAICFLYSRDKVEQYAKFIETNLHTEEKTTQIIQKECEHILRRLPNYKEYIVLEEYINLVKLLEKGVAIHHSGMIPIFKELVEIMFSKNYVKLLFATETFSVGLNMPTKTVIFTNLYKFDGNYKRLLYNHEYTQQAGRAGRRGYDDKGVVIHLNNLFEFPTNFEYKSLLINKSPSVSSKFKLSYDIILNGNSNIICKSLMSSEMANQITEYEHQIKLLNEKLSSIDNQLSSLESYNVLDEYHNLLSNNKKNNKFKELENEYSNIQKDYELYKDYLDTHSSILLHNKYIFENNSYVNYYLNYYKQFLIQHEFLDKESDELTAKGIIAKSLKEVHFLSMAKITIDTDYFKEFTPVQLIGIFSLFSNIKLENTEVYITDKQLLKQFDIIENTIDDIKKMEGDNNIYSYIETNIQKTIPYYTMDWANAKDEKECLNCINLLYNYENVYTGDFIKTLLKVINICKEYEIICNKLKQYDLLQKIKLIYPLILKYFVTNKSLYI